MSTLAPIRPGWSLPAAYYTSTEQFDTDLRRIWSRAWLFAGHSCEVSEAGRHLVFDIGKESLIVVRDEGGDLRALHNCCRHRGSRICDQPAGQVRRFVCPYHQWSYGLDGTLHGCGRMDEELGLDRDALSLASAQVEEVAGLVFVSLADEPASFAEARADLDRMLLPQGLAQARVAAVRRYTVGANWKLVWENNRECWHCHAGHHEYVRANYDTAGDNEDTRAELAERTAQLEAKGLEVDHASVGLATFPSPGRWWSANRTPNVPGFVTESLDGDPVAPPMGSYLGHDVGTVRSRIVPAFWLHASADHAVTTRVLPIGPLETRIDVTWLVDGSAEEGRDYELEKLLPFWQLTSEQDWALCERNQRGVLSSAYRPGPYSPSRESNVVAFVDWYLALVGNGTGW
jgi:Rieske 2Fe-2S family protein